MLKGKKIIIGISAGIAAYKICNLVRLFIKNGAEVRAIMTPSAVNFVSPLTLSVLSRNPVIINMFPYTDFQKAETITSGTWHISNGMWADLFICAPATANTLAKINAGISDNFLLSALLAARCPVILCPTMDEDMFKNEITQRNLKSLAKSGFNILEPKTGELASGIYGMGKMPEPEEIFEYARMELIPKDLINENILVTAGPTRQPIDPVRYISNYSSGKMGFAIAQAAYERGATVTLISGPTYLTCNANINRIDVETTDEMFEKVKANYKNSSLVIMSAAVSDFKVNEVSDSKIKKDKSKKYIDLQFEKTIDILAYIGKNKKNFKLYGFALETDDIVNNALRKLKEKNLDMIILNDANQEGAGFSVDTNIVTFIDKNNRIELPLMKKSEIANKILDYYLNKD